MRVIIDRFESDFAVIELPNGKTIHTLRELFGEAAEGDVVDIIVNHAETVARREMMKDRFAEIKE